MNSRPLGEEVAVLQQKVTDFDRTMSNIAGDIRDIKVALQTQNDLKNEIMNLKGNVVSLEGQITDIRRLNGLWSWIRVVVAGASTSVLTILVASYLDRLK